MKRLFTSSVFLLFLFSCGGQIDLTGSRFSCEKSDCPDGFHCNSDKFCIPDDEGDDDDKEECVVKPQGDGPCSMYLGCVLCCPEEDEKCENRCYADFVMSEEPCRVCQEQMGICVYRAGCQYYSSEELVGICSAIVCKEENMQCFGADFWWLAGGVPPAGDCKVGETCLRVENTIPLAFCIDEKHYEALESGEVATWGKPGERGGICSSSKGNEACGKDTMCVKIDEEKGGIDDGVCIGRCPLEHAVNPCSPVCEGKECGPDKCGLVCGECPAPKFCGENFKCIE